MAARRDRKSAAIAFYEEFGTDAAYDECSDHPRGFSREFLSATCEQQAAYESALRNEQSWRQKFYRAVDRAALAKIGAQP